MLLSTLATLGEIGSAIYGTITSAKANNQAQRADNTLHNINMGVLHSELNSDVTNNSEFRQLMSRLDQYDADAIARQQGINAVIGGNQGGIYAQKQANANAKTKMLSDFGASETAYKRGVRDDIMRENARFAQNKITTAQNKANTIATAAGQATQAMSGLARADRNNWADDLAMFGITKGLVYDEQTGHWRRA